MANLEVNQLPTAIANFEEVRRRQDDKELFDAATWYLALAQLKNEQKKLAIDLLTELIEAKSGAYSEDALVLKRKL